MAAQGRWLKRLALIALGLLVTVLILEIGVRVWVTYAGNERQHLLYLYSRDDISRLATRFQGVAYLNYGLSPRYPQSNSLGYRGPEIAIPKPPGVFRIVALGGSSTYGEFIAEWQDAYPAQLERILRDDYGYDHVEVVNAGIPGYTSWELTVNFMFRVLDLDPDLIIIYEAINDINPRLSAPEFYNGLNTGHGYWRELDDPLPPSALYRFLAARLFDWQPTVAYGLDRQFVQPEGYRDCGLVIQEGKALCANLGMTAEEVLRANPPVYFERNIRHIVILAQAEEIQVLLSSWAYSPAVFDRPGGDFLSYEFRQAAVAEHNVILRAIADEFQVSMYDLAASMPQNRQYWVDGMHVNPRGAREQARQYAAFMVEAGLLPAQE
jgi:lysophospholipase L1-like esterase